LITGYSDLDSVISAINDGHIYQYIAKPWEPTQLEVTVAKASERFLLERELAKKNKDLEKAYTDLKSLDQAKSQFMMLINHELKTPLTAIMSYSELLAESELNDLQTRMISRIKEGSDRLNNLINDTLELLNAETGNIQKKQTEFSLGEILKMNISILTPRLGGRKIKASSEFENLRVLNDKKIIENILYRIIDNAIKFSPDGSEIQIHATQLESGRIGLKVSNEGKKLSQEIMENLTQPFFLNENALNHSTGTGLGLSICQAHLKNQNSRLYIESAENQFSVSFEL